MPVSPIKPAQCAGVSYADTSNTAVPHTGTNEWRPIILGSFGINELAVIVLAVAFIAVVVWAVVKVVKYLS